MPLRLVSRLIKPETVLIEAGPGDDVLKKISKGTVSIYGYYQNVRIVETMWPDLLARFSQSKDFSELVGTKIVNRIALHLRFGDYSDDPKTRASHGLTESTFFSKSIEQLIKNEGASGNILVITDDINKASKFVATLRTSASIECVSSANPISDLLAISQSSHVITSNSTFSWWGAWLAYKLHDAKVVYPRPWFADESDPDLPIYVPQWISRKREYLAN